MVTRDEATTFDDEGEVRRFNSYVSYLNSGDARRPRSAGKDLQYLLGHREDRSSMPDELSQSFTWFLPGLAYTVARLDRSIFQLFANSVVGRGLSIPTYDSPQRVLRVTPADVDHSWYYTVQGLPATHFQAFGDFLAGLRIDNKVLGVRMGLSVGRTKFRGVYLHTLLPFTESDFLRSEISGSSDRQVVVRVVSS